MKPSAQPRANNPFPSARYRNVSGDLPSETTEYPPSPTHLQPAREARLSVMQWRGSRHTPQFHQQYAPHHPSSAHHPAPVPQNDLPIVQRCPVPVSSDDPLLFRRARSPRPPTPYKTPVYHTIFLIDKYLSTHQGARTAPTAQNSPNKPTIFTVQGTPPLFPRIHLLLYNVGRLLPHPSHFSYLPDTTSCRTG